MFTSNRFADDHSLFEIMVYYKDKIKKIKHHDQGPAVTAYKSDGTPLAEQWYVENRLHRQDGPASLLYFPDHPHVMREEWYQEGILHRCGAPAVTLYDHNGVVLSQQWYQEGRLHRDEGPAWIELQPERNSYEEMWYCQGRLHRENGPAVRVLINGQTVNRSYYLEGVQKMTSNL